MSPVPALLPLAIFLSQPEARPLPLAEVAVSAIFEVCVPLIADNSFDEAPWFKHRGASKDSGEKTDIITYSLATSDAGIVEVVILTDRTVCGVRYVGNHEGVAAISGQLVKRGWEGRSALGGQVWRKERIFAITTWASERPDGAHEGTASVVRPDSQVAAELAAWFAPIN